MTRTVSSVMSAAVAQDVTTPVYLIRLSWATEKRIATWDVDITWNSETWEASGARVNRLRPEGGTLILPNGDGDPWLDLVQDELARDRVVEIYEHHTSTASPSGSDAEKIFVGRMDGVAITIKGIKISLIEGRTNKGFPPSSIGPPTYTWLLPVGLRIKWGRDVITVN